MRKEIFFVSLFQLAALSFVDASRPLQGLGWKSNEDSVPVITIPENYGKVKRPRVGKRLVPATTRRASLSSFSTPVPVEMWNKRQDRRRQSVVSDKPTITKKSTKGYPKGSIGFDFQLDPNAVHENDKSGHSTGSGRHKKQAKEEIQKWKFQYRLKFKNETNRQILKFIEKATAPHKQDYGPCAGIADCVLGEECFDVNTKNKIECPQGTTCEACDGQVKLCPKGCKPGNGCPPAPLDGVCLDKEFAATDYLDEDEADLLERTPMVAFTGTLLAGQACNSYGAAIDLVQKGAAAIDEKVKILRTNQGSGVLGSEICNWSVSRLECIPNLPRVSTTPKSSGTGSQDTNNETPQGSTCQCMLALGTRPVKELDEVKDIEICYIPANRGTSSECDHEISPPHGIIDGLTPKGLKAFRGPEPASKFCVPNAECRTGYKYTGLRCMCQPKTTWDPKTFTCSKAITLRVKTSFSLLSVVIYLGLSS